MPRLARLDAPGVLHHVMIRGIERRNIFEDDTDRKDFIERLDILLPKTQTACYAWAFVSNHAHFLFRSGPNGLPLLMRRLLTGYAVAFNRRHNRQGQLFQNRYKSIVCQEDIYLKELVRYIHLNPVRAGIISDLTALNTYAYCGHAALMGKTNRNWQDTKYILGYFGKSIRQARTRYLSFVNAGFNQGRRDDLVGGGLIQSLGGWTEIKKMRMAKRNRIKGDERILGESDFVDQILYEANEKYTRQYELKRLGYDFKKVAERACEIYQLDFEYIFSKGRQQSKVNARSLICFWSVEELKMSIVSLAKIFEQSPSTISYAVERGKGIAAENNYHLIPE